MVQIASYGFIGHTNEAVLYPAEIYAVGTPSMGYVWHWRAADASHQSSGGFNMFYDCLQDARASGFEPYLRPEDPVEEITEAPVILSAINVAPKGPIRSRPPMSDLRSAAR